VGADYGRALELLDRLGVVELCVFDHRRRRLEPLGPSALATGGRGEAGGDAGQAKTR
jgi:hypothetical protein